MAEDAIDLSIVLPCYNEADNLPLVLQGYAAVWRSDLNAELILVDNGSTDHSAEVLREQLQKPEFSFARTVLVPANRGYGHGILTGLKSARGKVLCFSHADMQCPPADAFRAYERLTAEADPERVFIKGRRGWRGWGPAILTGGMTLVASLILLGRYRDNNAQPKAFCRGLLDALIDPPDGFQFDLYCLFKARKNGLKLVTLPVLFQERAHGESKWAFNLLSRWRHIWAMVRFIFGLRFGLVR